jgi:transcriptional regulator with XRE-family HTH domain
VGARLKEVRGRQTQLEFAARLGLSQAQYNRYETGKRLAPDEVLHKAAAEAGLEPAEMVFGPAPAGSAQTSPYGRAVAELVELLDSESQEDLLFYLKSKTRALSRRRQTKVRQAMAALESLRRQAG